MNFKNSSLGIISVALMSGTITLHSTENEPKISIDAPFLYKKTLSFLARHARNEYFTSNNTEIKFHSYMQDEATYQIAFIIPINRMLKIDNPDNQQLISWFQNWYQNNKNNFVNSAGQEVFTDSHIQAKKIGCSNNVLQGLITFRVEEAQNMIQDVIQRNNDTATHTTPAGRKDKQLLTGYKWYISKFSRVLERIGSLKQLMNHH